MFPAPRLQLHSNSVADNKKILEHGDCGYVSRLLKCKGFFRVFQDECPLLVNTVTTPRAEFPNGAFSRLQGEAVVFHSTISSVCHALFSLSVGLTPGHLGMRNIQRLSERAQYYAKV